MRIATALKAMMKMKAISWPDAKASLSMLKLENFMRGINLIGW
jgi:hypothetical protein